MKLTEAEFQILASIEEANSAGLIASRTTLEKRSDRYRFFKEDRSNAFNSLEEQWLVSVNDRGYELTDSGRPLAKDYYAERPNLYWYYYQKFYDLVERSKVHSRFCEIVFGEDRSQEDQTDMEFFNDLLSRLRIQPEYHLLDLGCGAGGLSEYIYDTYGASVAGIDYSASAIRTAHVRTEGKREKLQYLQADLNSLDLPADADDSA